MNPTEKAQQEAMAIEPLLRPDTGWRHYGCGNVRGGSCQRCGERLGTRPLPGARILEGFAR